MRLLKRIEGRLDREIKSREEIEYLREKFINGFWRFDPEPPLSL
jgi:hypothetical protein